MAALKAASADEPADDDPAADDEGDETVTQFDLIGAQKPNAPSFRYVTLHVRTLRGTASGSNSVTHVMPTAAPAAPAPKPPRKAARRPAPLAGRPEPGPPVNPAATALANRDLGLP